MQRSLLLLLLLSACVRREVGSGEWTGVVRPDAALSTSGPARDEGAPVKGAGDAGAPPPSGPDQGGDPGAGFSSTDAAPRPEAAPGVSEPVAPSFDASIDAGDARSCPESGQCD